MDISWGFFFFVLVIFLTLGVLGLKPLLRHTDRDGWPD